MFCNNIYQTMLVFLFLHVLYLSVHLSFYSQNHDPVCPQSTLFSVFCFLWRSSISHKGLILNKQNTGFILTNKSQAVYILWAAKPDRGLFCWTVSTQTSAPLTESTQHHLPPFPSFSYTHTDTHTKYNTGVQTLPCRT